MAGVHADGTNHRLYRTVYADTEEEARAELAQFVTEVRGSDGTTRADVRRVTFDAAVRRFLYEHLLDQRGREPKTVDDYWKLHLRWFSPHSASASSATSRGRCSTAASARCDAPDSAGPA